jgi:ribosomal protein S18 acetylase RimI-like enzyme
MIREATKADAEEIARVHWHASNVAYGREDDFSRRLASTNDALELDYVRSFVAEVDGTIVGLTHVGTDELYAMYVHPDHWGSGVGQALIDRAHEELAETCDEARLTVLTDNLRARRFYERNGWELVERLTELHFGGEETDVCRYRRAFSRSSSPR